MLITSLRQPIRLFNQSLFPRQYYANSLGSIPYQIRWAGQPPTPQDIASVKVSQIYDLNPHDVLGNSYFVDIAIKSLAPNQPCWYLACASCKRTVGSEKDTYKCPKCGVTIPETRYRITVLGVDPADIDKDEPKIAEFILFSELGEQLVGSPVQQLVQSTAGNTELIPTEITRLYGKRYSLKVSVTRGALQRIQISYQVDSMSVLLPVSASTSSSLKNQQEISQIATTSSPTSMVTQESNIPPTTPAQSTPAAIQLSPLLNPALMQEPPLANEPSTDLPDAMKRGNASTQKTSAKRKLFEDITKDHP